MKKIITISREYGSGGRLIGKLVAESLGYDFYDKEIIDMAAQESGLSPDFIKKTEQNLSSGFLYNLLLGSSYSGTANGASSINGTQMLPLADQVFNAERKVILDLAKKGNCVIVGRCADYILNTSDEIDSKSLLNVFIYGNLEEKLKRIEDLYKEPEQAAKKTIQQIDKRRANHYNTFTEATWGDRKNYDIMINSSTAGIEETARLISEIAKHQ
ncbi:MULTISPECIES: AAA family ATPase [Treponema]|uniref:Cytidylate kinase n=1 Tax=Treponema berlinense TaxID=225004 RepID=A0A1T4Q2B3_9SPIR|nr:MULTISPECIES: cytidylate kinase-like family protein [Treponema]MBQ9101554.1 cytidylate kinase-like family protein [Treponema sp.]MDD5835146.1 cytidylate kinase-like family protein [Treponema berlinense]MDY3707467.1 cytidylate kinase-like family protein [Treponema berlinense]SJZ97869.1 Cytidylate kinase [Treponema berlinense]